MRTNMFGLALFGALAIQGMAAAADRPSTPDDITTIQRTIKSYFASFPEVDKAVSTAQGAVAKGQCVTSDELADTFEPSLSIVCRISSQRELVVMVRLDGEAQGRPSAAKRYAAGEMMTRYVVTFPHAQSSSSVPLVEFRFYDGRP